MRDIARIFILIEPSHLKLHCSNVYFHVIGRPSLFQECLCFKALHVFKLFRDSIIIVSPIFPNPVCPGDYESEAIKHGVSLPHPFKIRQCELRDLCTWLIFESLTDVG